MIAEELHKGAQDIVAFSQKKALESVADEREHAKNLSWTADTPTDMALSAQRNRTDSPAQFPSESGRYRFDASQHVHLLDGRPLMGTSTVVQVLGKEGLTWWSAELAAVVCLESGEHIPTIRQEYESVCALSGKDKKNARDRLQRKYPVFKKARYAHKEKKESAAGPGTDMHAELERYVKLCIYEEGGTPGTLLPCNAAVNVFSQWAVANVSEFLWSEGYCYSETLWTGGVCDCGAVLHSGEVAFIDFKSSKEAYFGQFIQCAGYARQINESGVLSIDGKPVNAPVDLSDSALIVFPFGAPGPKPHVIRNTKRYCDVFEAAVLIHRLNEAFADMYEH